MGKEPGKFKQELSEICKGVIKHVLYPPLFVP